MNQVHKLVVDASKSPLKLSIPEGNFIKALISKYTGMTQSEFSIQIGMDKSLLSRYLSGNLVMTDQALVKILNGIVFIDPNTNEQYKYDAIWESRIIIRPCKIGPLVPTVDSTEVDVT